MDTLQSMAAYTSPSITGLSNGGVEDAFQGSSGGLITYGDGGFNNPGWGCAEGRAPALPPLAAASRSPCRQLQPRSSTREEPSDRANRGRMGWRQERHQRLPPFRAAMRSHSGAATATSGRWARAHMPSIRTGD